MLNRNSCLWGEVCSFLVSDSVANTLYFLPSLEDEETHDGYVKFKELVLSI